MTNLISDYNQRQYLNNPFQEITGHSNFNFRMLEPGYFIE